LSAGMADPPSGCRLKELSEMYGPAVIPRKVKRFRFAEYGGWGGIVRLRRTCQMAALRFAVRDSRLRAEQSNCVLHPPKGSKIPLCGIWRMGGDSNPRCLAAHTLSRRAQSTALSPILCLRRAAYYSTTRLLWLLKKVSESQASLPAR